ncbi:hypothetical protein [Martelella sp. HB161492]|uniref:hypothetical protein n=1 Tax=Martelella sp. HB161492 TaxID=2720726 RepID=UPI001591E8DE|nr:hypothetical protein [Martelella sp. HB161492]
MEHDLFLKFEDEAAARTALSVAGIGTVDDGEGNIRLPFDGALADGSRFALSICGSGSGTLHAPTGETIDSVDESGAPIKMAVYAAIAGYHINIRFEGMVPESLAIFDTAPDTPAERFA